MKTASSDTQSNTVTITDEKIKGTCDSENK
jgi:hypothetical protein